MIKKKKYKTPLNTPLIISHQPDVEKKSTKKYINIRLGEGNKKEELKLDNSFDRNSSELRLSSVLKKEKGRRRKERRSFSSKKKKKKSEARSCTREGVSRHEGGGRRKGGVAHVEEEGRRRVAFYIFTPRSPFFARPPVNERAHDRPPPPPPAVHFTFKPPQRATRPFAVAVVSWTGFLCRISPQGIYKKRARVVPLPSLSLSPPPSSRVRRETHTWIHGGRTRRCTKFNLENN